MNLWHLRGLTILAYKYEERHIELDPSFSFLPTFTVFCFFIFCLTVVPERPNGPGTTSYIAQRGGQSSEVGFEKDKRQRCGQCEKKTAQVVQQYTHFSNVYCRVLFVSLKKYSRFRQ